MSTVLVFLKHVIPALQEIEAELQVQAREEFRRQRLSIMRGNLNAEQYGKLTPEQMEKFLSGGSLSRPEGDPVAE